MKRLEAWQRYEIAVRLEAVFTKKQVAEFLHVHPPTITWEIQRNGYSRYIVYRPKIAQESGAPLALPQASEKIQGRCQSEG